ncbi:sensor histidine kinase [Saccharopolyspora cebuensis]|uniref:sensor histidine kinase n=1 Tax=Saccharopolyspora cebuensis TaxID=418759 RepID=UPI0031F02888
MLLVVFVGGSAVFVSEAVYTQQVGQGVREMSLPAVKALESLQRERQVSLDAVSRGASSPPELLAQQAETDRTLREMSSAAEPMMASAPDELKEPMTELTGQFDRLPEIRSRIASGTMSINELNAYFNGTFDTATQLFETQARIVPSADTLQGGTAAAELFRASDMLARQSSLISTALAVGELQPGQHQEFARLNGGMHATLDDNLEFLRPSVQADYEALTTTPEWQQLLALENALIVNGPWDSGDTPPISAADWRRVSDQVLGQVSGLVAKQADLVSQQAVADGTSAMTTVLWSALAVLVVAAAFFIGTRRVYTHVVDHALLTRLQNLRTESLHLAQHLPEVVEKLREGESVDVDDSMSTLRRYGNDEVGQVANAIQLFQREAMDAAVGETRARQGARAVFVGMAHRLQQLLRSAYNEIDQLERNEENSQQLARLWNLDNLLTRARRKVENLLVLGDQTPGRRWSKPVPLYDVLRSATSEIGQYKRVMLGHVPNVAVSGLAVGDTIHLASELIDNATAFSPPNTQVHITAVAVARGVAITIDDQGLGMDENIRVRANVMMSDPPEFDRLVLESSKAEQLGLFTAARLAQRRDIGVEFGTSAYGGTRATVLLPDRILNNLDEPTSAPALTDSTTGWDGAIQDEATALLSTVETTGEQPAWPDHELSGQLPATATTSIPERRQSSADKRERPPLPRRDPGTHLEDLQEETPTQNVVADPGRLAGFHQAFRGAFSDNPDDRSK